MVIRLSAQDTVENDAGLGKRHGRVSSKIHDLTNNVLEWQT